MSWNIFKKIALIHKIKKALKQAKKSIDTNKGLAAEIKNRLNYLIADIEELLGLLPQFKPIYKEVIEIVKEIF